MIKLTIDTSGLDEVASQVDRMASDSGVAQDLAWAAYQWAHQLATEKLHSSLPKFLSALQIEQISEHEVALVLRQEARWIEDGQGPWDMADSLINVNHPGRVPTQTGKNGQRYRRVPFGSMSTYDYEPLLSIPAPIRDAFSGWKLQEHGRPAFLWSGIPLIPPKADLSQGQVRILTVSESTIGLGRWMHPGTKGAGIFDEIVERMAEVDFDWDERLG